MKELHNNENYKVIAHDGSEVIHGGNTYRNSYHVVNKLTGFTEFKTPALPEAIFIAEDLNAAMVNEAWNWRKAEEKAMAEALAKAPQTEVFN